MVDQKKEKQLREAIELLFFSYRSFTAEPDRILHQRGLNRIHHRILYFVGRDQGLSVNELLHVLQISKQALHAPLRQLVAMSLVTSVKAVHDRRVRELRLTAEGRRLESRLTGTQMRLLNTVFDTANAAATTGKDPEAGWRLVMETLAEDLGESHVGTRS